MAMLSDLIANNSLFNSSAMDPYGNDTFLHNLTSSGTVADSGRNPMQMDKMKKLMMAKKMMERRAQVGRIAVKYHLVLGTLILLANGFLIGFYIKYPKIRRYISVTVLSAFLASFLQVCALLCDRSFKVRICHAGPLNVNS